MNKVYQVIWSRVKNSYVVVSELAGTSHKKKRSVSIRAISLAAFLAMSMTAPAVEAAEPYTILVDGKGNIVSAETDLSGTGGTVFQNSIAGGVYSISIGKGAETKGDYSAAIGEGNVAGGVGSLVFGDRNYTGITPETTDKGASYFQYKTSEGTAYATLDGLKIYTKADGTPCFSGSLPVLVGEDGQTYIVRESWGEVNVYKATVRADGSVKVNYLKEQDPVAFEKVYGELLTDKDIAGKNAVAFGTNNLAIGDNSLAFGRKNLASGESSVAFGEKNTASGENAVAFGENNTASGENSIAFGLNNTASGENAVAFGGTGGYTNVASGDRSMVWGQGNEASGEGSTVWGNLSVAEGENSTAWGDRNVASGENATSWGSENLASGNEATAWGQYTHATGEASTSWGIEDTIAAGYASTAFGRSNANGEFATSFGFYSTANGNNSTSWGDHTTADYKIEYFANGATAYIKKSGNQDIYVDGYGIQLLTDAEGVPVVYNGKTIRVRQDGNGYVMRNVAGKGYQPFKATVNADGSLSIATTPTEGFIAYQTIEGDFETVENNTAFGKNTVSSGNQATVWGDGSAASGDNATAWGEETIASGKNATAWGMESVSSGERATAWGEYTIAAGMDATAWGDESEAYGDYSTAFGDVSIAGGHNSLAALGGKTGVEDVASDTKSFSGGSNSAAIGWESWAKTDNSIALGSYSVADREAGQGADYLEHSGYDVKTGKESTATDSVWRSTESAIAIGDPENNVTRQITGVAAGYEDTDAVNVAQLKEVRALAGRETIVEAGSQNISVQGSEDQDGNMKYIVDLATDVTLGEGDKQINIKGSEGTVTVGTGDSQVKLDSSDGSVTAGGITINQDGQGTVNGLTNKTWSEGTYISGQGATEDQLHQVESNVNTKIDSVNQKIDQVSKTHTTVSVNDHTETGNLVLKKTDATEDAGANYDISLSHDVTIGSTGDDGKDGKLTITSQDGTKSVVTDGQQGSLTFKDGEKQTSVQADGVVNGVDGTEIHRVASDGHTVATLDDGMKYSGDSGSAAVKLNNNVKVYGGATEYSDGNNIGVVASQDGDNAALQVRLARNLQGINSIEATTITAKTVNSDTFQSGNTTINHSGVVIQTNDNSRTITIQDGNINMGGNKIEGVAPGTVAPGSTDAVNGSQLAATNQNISVLGDRVNRVGAGAAALAGLHPLDFDPDNKWDFAAGYGNYKNANAFAIGAYYRPNEDTMFSIGGSFAGGENMVNAGISWKFGQKNNVSRSRVSVAKDVLALQQQVAVLTKELEAYKSGSVTKGKASVQRNINFPDVPENHWAYTYVKILADRGYLKGYPDGEFKGDRAMTRYEYAAIIYRALQNGAPSDGNMIRSMDEFGPEISKAQELDRFRVDRISGKDDDRHKVERVRINDRDDKDSGDFRDVYGSHIRKS